MNEIKYPAGIPYTAPTKIHDHHAHRGVRLEKDINDSNTYYRECNIALIYKKPTPVQVVHVDYPQRNKAKITEAYYKLPSTTDYNGIYRGRYIDFEAKETKNKTQFPIQMIHDHQIKHLEKVLYHGGIGFFIIRFTSLSNTFLVDAQELITIIKQTDRSTIPYSWFETHGHLIQESYCPRLAYLKVVDQCYFKEDF